MSFYMIDKAYKVRTDMTHLEDIGPEFNFTLNVRDASSPSKNVHYLQYHLSIESTESKNQLFYNVYLP